MSYLSLVEDSLRYLKYSLTFIAALFFYVKEFKTISVQQAISRKYIYFFLKFYGILFSAYLLIELFTDKLTFRFFADCLFVILPAGFIYYLIPFIRYERINYYFKLICFFTILGYIIEKNDAIISSISDWHQLISGIADSSVKSESNLYPFLLAFLFIYAFYYKLGFKWILSLFLFSLLGFKRIVILGLLLTIILSFFPVGIYNKIRKNATLSSCVFSVIALLIIVIYYYIAGGYFDSYLYNKFDISTNELLQGRQELYSLVIDKIGDNKLFTGAGIGVIDEILIKNAKTIDNITNLHSELLRWFLEIGVVGYLAWIYVIFRNALYTRYMFLSFIFLFIMLLTDNVFIYFDCMFYFYLLSVFSLMRESQKSQNEFISRLATKQA